MGDADTFTWNATLMEWDPALPLSVSMECACVNFTNSTDPCYAHRSDEDFNLGLHIGSIFIILGIDCIYCCYSFDGSLHSLLISAASLLGVILPLVIAAIPSTPLVFRKVLYYGKFFGSGVILSTGYDSVSPSSSSLTHRFVHIFPDACSTLQQPCLPQWFQDFAAAPGLFALLGAFNF